MLTFVGLGLYDERSVTVAGREAIADSDRAFAELYTSRLVGTTVADLEAYHDCSIEVRDRGGVERDPEPILDAAADSDVAFLTAGDPMVATTHVDLRLRAHERGIETQIVHGVSAETAAAGLTGLQNYRFGPSTTLPFPWAHGGEEVPDGVVETVEDNDDRGLHTLVFLDIKVDPPRGYENRETFLTADRAADLLTGPLGDDRLAVAVARAGSDAPVVVADDLGALAERSFGEPLHLLVLPGDLHDIEATALTELVGGPGGAVARQE